MKQIGVVNQWQSCENYSNGACAATNLIEAMRTHGPNPAHDEYLANDRYQVVEFWGDLPQRIAPSSVFSAVFRQVYYISKMPRKGTKWLAAEYRLIFSSRPPLVKLEQLRQFRIFHLILQDTQKLCSYHLQSSRQEILP